MTDTHVLFYVDKTKTRYLILNFSPETRDTQYARLHGALRDNRKIYVTYRDSTIRDIVVELYDMKQEYLLCNKAEIPQSFRYVLFFDNMNLDWIHK